MPMGLNTTAFNSDELITSYIDNQISDPDLIKQVEDMIKNDVRFYNKYHAELLTKKLFNSRIKEAELPRETYLKVTNSINFLAEKHRENYALKPGYSAQEYRKNFWES